VVNRVTGAVVIAIGWILIGAAEISGTNYGPAIGVVVAAAACAILWIGIRFLVMRVVLTDSELVIHNIWRNYHVPWADVARLVPSTIGVAPRPIGIETKSGRVIRFTGISPGRGERKAVSDQWFKLLEREYRSHGPTMAQS
jgi:hypothetical protein